MALADGYHRQGTGRQQPEIQVVSHTKWTFYYIHFSPNLRGNLPLQVSSTKQSSEIECVLSYILKKKKRGNWIPVLCGRRGEGRGKKVQKGGKRHRFPETSSCAPPPCTSRVCLSITIPLLHQWIPWRWYSPKMLHQNMYPIAETWGLRYLSLNLGRGLRLLCQWNMILDAKSRKGYNFHLALSFGGSHPAAML